MAATIELGTQTGTEGSLWERLCDPTPGPDSKPGSREEAIDTALVGKITTSATA
eukprot:CAMPEP_0206574590 /NCGR_PEP_ID=MMETSP0325_2-20121206/29548_1 /ASSEMBLY_ACC=CAM_ASM_000347 /TAXON_ID=2866 /ORGANISM="Crypthecodinium cohnii, Strain Seligo" /LENGTH=53 /DNA_ID=CAMNT_0054079247 /DNA_START=428 /DNA_END=585 /DNA_ORIENTATION=+